MYDPTKPYKAVVGFILSFATAVFVAVQGREDLETLSTVEWLVIFLGAFVTAAGVYATTNPPVGRRR